MTDTQELVRTRAEQLRDHRFTNGGWQTANLSPMFSEAPSRETLLRCITRAEEELPALETAAVKAKTKADRADSEARNRGHEWRRTLDDLDVYKIMLAEQMEIPA